MQDSNMNLSQNPDKIASCKSYHKPEFLPPDLCGLDPLFHVFNRMYIQDILSMSEYPTIPGAFAYKNHPIFKVDVLGVVVKVDKKTKLHQYGEISKLNNYLPSTLASQVQRIKESMEMDFMLGDLIHVRGKVTTFHQIRQITANFAVRVIDSLSESSRMIELPRLYKNVYNKPFQVPCQLNKEMEELDSDAIKKKMIEDLTVMLKRHLRDSQKKLFDVKQVLQNKNLHSAILEVSSKDQRFADPQSLLEITVEAMERTGEICRRKDKKHTYEVLLLSDSELSAFILNILQKEKHHNTHSENGCHMMKVFSEVKKTFQYADVCMASVRYCLDLLEMNSDIIRTTDSHYVVC